MGSFTLQAWADIESVRTAIDDLPFVVALGNGELSAERFTYYLAQDAHYLADYARVLAACAAQATDPDEVVFWSTSSRQAILVERALHASHVADFAATAPSPTCTAYTSYLLALAGAGSYPALVAGVLPCFWIYADVGSRLRAAAAGAGAGAGVGARVRAHPYADWIATYGDPAFEAATEQVRCLTNRLAQDAGPGTRRAMHRAFHTAARYEWMFWDAAWRQEDWPI